MKLNEIKTQGKMSREEIAKVQVAFREELQAALQPYMKKNGWGGFVAGTFSEGYAISPDPPGPRDDLEEADALRKQIKKDIKPILDEVANGRHYQISYNKHMSWDVVVRVPISSVTKGSSN